MVWFILCLLLLDKLLHYASLPSLLHELRGYDFSQKGTIGNKWAELRVLSRAKLVPIHQR